MPELATIRIFEHTRGRRFSAQLGSTETGRVIIGPRQDNLIDAVLKTLAKYERATRYRTGDRGRPPAAQNIPDRLEGKRRRRRPSDS
jgi:hypothetical protein